ncbi:hypothetical protein [Metasolibacillus meyeri]|uniref:hypothetical protein n=1 Tax=Metasolibacillus meyeri TaxID=1071052 RepID=UPI000D314F20|nr:hypothetical protein [Metasolibacillus meyeri]
MKKYTIPTCKNCNSGELVIIPDNFGLVNWGLTPKKVVQINTKNIFPVSVFACENCGYVELKLLAEIGE